MYRLFHSLAFYSVPAILTVSLVITVLFGGKEQEYFTAGEIIGSASTMLVSVIFLAVDLIAVYLWNAEHRHGYIKNLAGIVSSRHMPVISKMITGSFICLVYTSFALMYAFLSIILSGLKITEGVQTGQVTELILLAATGIASVVMILALYELSHSPALCYILVIMIWTGLLENMLIQLSYLVFKWENTGRYLLITGLGWDNSGTCEDVIRILLYLLVSAAAAVFISKKKDIKV